VTGKNFRQSCARCGRVGEHSEWVRWPELLDEFAGGLGYVCPGCLTEQDHSRLAMLRELGEERTVLAFDLPPREARP